AAWLRTAPGSPYTPRGAVIPGLLSGAGGGGLLLVGLDVDRDEDVVAEDGPADVQRPVPDDAVVLAVDGGGRLETRLFHRVHFREAEEGDRERDFLGDAVDRQRAGHVVAFAALRRDLAALERDLREL